MVALKDEELAVGKAAKTVGMTVGRMAALLALTKEFWSGSMMAEWTVSL